VSKNNLPDLPLKQFINLGFLQELNRLFLHPAGLALTAKLVDGEYKLDRIVDARTTPEVLQIDGTKTEMLKKALMVSQSIQNTETRRIETLGFSVQSLRIEEQPLMPVDGIVID